MRQILVVCTLCTGRPSISGPLRPTCTHSVWDTAITYCVHLWGVGGNWSTQRKPMQKWGEPANSTQWLWLGINFLFPHQRCNEMTE